jgi:riboflavin-specific deaminase-like protein
VDAIAIGSGTLLVDDPQLTAREVYRERPLTRIVLDRSLRTPPTARLLSTLGAGPVIIMTSARAVAQHATRARALEQAGAHLLAIDSPLITDVLRALTAHGIQSVILEGGASVQRAALSEDVVDYVQLYLAPVFAGVSGVPLVEDQMFPGGGLVEQQVRQLGPDTLIEGYVHRPH